MTKLFATVALAAGLAGIATASMAQTTGVYPDPYPTTGYAAAPLGYDAAAKGGVSTPRNWGIENRGYVVNPNTEAASEIQDRLLEQSHQH